MLTPVSYRCGGFLHSGSKNIYKNSGKGKIHSGIHEFYFVLPQWNKLFIF